MNDIRINRLILSGFVTLAVFIGTEILVESFFGGILFRSYILEHYSELKIPIWSLRSQALNIGIALLNCMMLVWLYAALRPMFGVGTKTALITSLYWLVFVTAFSINMANLGYYPWRIALIESFYLIIELPIAMIAGSLVYEQK